MRKTFAGTGKNAREQKRGQRLRMVAVESVYKNTKGAPIMGTPFVFWTVCPKILLEKSCGRDYFLLKNSLTSSVGTTSVLKM